MHKQWLAKPNMQAVASKFQSIVESAGTQVAEVPNDIVKSIFATEAKIIPMDRNQMVRACKDLQREACADGSLAVVAKEKAVLIIRDPINIDFLEAYRKRKVCDHRFLESRGLHVYGAPAHGTFAENEV